MQQDTSHACITATQKLHRLCTKGSRPGRPSVNSDSQEPSYTLYTGAIRNDSGTSDCVVFELLTLSVSGKGPLPDGAWVCSWTTQRLASSDSMVIAAYVTSERQGYRPLSRCLPIPRCVPGCGHGRLEGWHHLTVWLI
eukprot:1159322-Pelagomonas_calceolata.AAC.4